MNAAAGLDDSWVPEPTTPKPTRRRRPSLPGQDAFYVPPAGFAALDDGAVLRSREIEVALYGIVPQKVSAWQLLYRSCDLHGVPEAAVTTVLLPYGADHTRSRPLLAYQCAIDAVAAHCFPSYALQRGAPVSGASVQGELLLLATALGRGWAVSIVDHEGMRGCFGAPREPGYRVLDGIRAALSFPQLGLRASTPVALWGYSGGGLATSWVAELAPEYAPELHIVGAALGAPVGDPGNVFVRLNGTILSGLPAIVVAGLRHIYPSIDRMIHDHISNAGLRKLDSVERSSTVGAIVGFAREDFGDYADRPLTELLAAPEIRDVFDDLRLGGRIPACPLLVVQAVHDPVISVDDIDAQVNRYIDGGGEVTYIRDRLSEHILLAVLSAPAVLDWLSDRFAGRPVAAPGITTVRSMAFAPGFIRGFLAIAAAAAKAVFARPLR